MEGQSAKWIIRGNELLDETAATSIRSYLNMLYDQVDKDDQRPVVPLSLGDPSAFSCFRTSPEAEDAIVRAVQSAEFNSYAPINGILPARRAVAEYISADLPYNLSADDVYLTAGCTQSIEVVLSVLARPGANILLPKPGYPLNSVENLRKFKLTEDDILRVGRLILPAANLAISKTRELFSGEPSMTLKVIPFLLLGAEYGHLVTLRRLCGIGFFICFTIPKLYACYSSQINQKVEHMKCRVLTAWGACSHKKMVAASAVTAFWNLSSVKTRIFTAFVSLVILRCCRQQLMPNQEEGRTKATTGISDGRNDLPEPVV